MQVRSIDPIDDSIAEVLSNEGTKQALPIENRTLEENKMFTTSWLKSLLIIAFFGVFSLPADVLAELAIDSKREKKPNVLFIAVDDLRAELGCYGSSIVKSPNIDALASRGTLFQRAYCQQAVCNPSRASLLTGLRPETLGIWDLPTHFRQRRPEIVTLPQLFKQHGYFTQNIGKIFHNWRQDAYKGDAPSWSVPAEMHYASHGSDNAQIDKPLPEDMSGVPRTEKRDVPDEAYFDGRVARKAIAALRNRKQDGKPFFLAVGFWKPHAPFNAPTKYWELYEPQSIEPPKNPYPPIDVPKIAMHDSREILRGFKDRPESRPTPADTLVLRHGYYAATSFVDAMIGSVLDELHNLGLSENTIVVLWSDHGFHLGEHRLWAKTSNFELDARVPLIISTPWHQGGKESNSLVELLDLYPTLADLCDLPSPSDLEGKSLRRILEDSQSTVKQAAFTWHPRPAYPAAGKKPEVMGYSMRTQRFRFTQWRDFKTEEVIATELYDHQSDPGETVNIANSEQGRAVRERLIELWKEAGE